MKISPWVTLGRGPREAVRELVPLLLECHQRIRYFCALARRLGDDPAPEHEVTAAAARAHRYFRDALPLHAEDEEQTVDWRLRCRTSDLDGALERMAREHQEHRPVVDRLVALLAARAAREAGVARELGLVAVTLEAMLLAHLEHEEQVVLPAIVELLPPRVQRCMVAELTARRQARGWSG